MNRLVVNALFVYKMTACLKYEKYIHLLICICECSGFHVLYHLMSKSVIRFFPLDVSEIGSVLCLVSISSTELTIPKTLGTIRTQSSAMDNLVHDTEI